MQLEFLKKNWFILGIILALVFGFFFPEFGTRLNSGSIFSTVLIVLLFFISGAKLPSESIKSGLKGVRLHIYLQVFIFLLMPLFLSIAALPLGDRLDGQLRVGFYALACLPTTISSCILFTQVSEGNVVATMFNAALANILGIVLSPLLLSFLMNSAGRALPVSELADILQSLALKMLIPIITGQIARKWLKQKVNAHKKALSTISNLFIITILFFAFSKTALNPDFANNLKFMPLPFLYLAVLHVIIVAIAFAGARLLRFSREDTISILFTAPQKTVAMGVPLLSTYFSDDPALLGVALLPLLFYHPWQLFVAGFIRKFTERLKDRVPR